jgi:hypothetical protein
MMFQIHDLSSHQKQFLSVGKDKKIKILTKEKIKFNILVPVVLVTGVLPICLVTNCAGALTSYQSFLENGFMLN